MHLNGDNHIQNFHLGRYIVGYTFGNHVLRLRSRIAVKLNFRPYIRRYTSPNVNFEYSYPLNKFLTQKLLKQDYRYHKLRKTVSKFYRRYYDLISKFQVGLKSLLCQGLWEPDFYGDLVYKLKKIFGSDKKIGYNINVLQQTACLVVNPLCFPL